MPLREVNKTLHEGEFEAKLVDETGKKVNRGFFEAGLLGALAYVVDNSTASKNLLAEE